jgi:flagellar hook-length control protein FliK
MSTRVESNRPSASKANDLLKNLSLKASEASSAPQPFKKELAKAQRASDKPKPEAKAEELQAKKPQKAEKKSDVKGKKPARPRDAQADEQPMEAVESTESVKKPETVDQSDDAPETDEIDTEKPADSPKVKAEAGADEEPIEVLVAVANAPTPQVAKADVPPEANDDSSEAQAAVARPKTNALGNEPQKTDAGDAKASVKVKKDGEQDAEGAIDLSQLDGVMDRDTDEVDDDAVAVPAQPQAEEADADRRAEQAAARPAPRITTAQAPPLAIQPVQQQVGQQGNGSHLQMNADEHSQASGAMQMLADATDSATDASATATGTRPKAPAASADGEPFASIMQKAPEAGSTVKTPAAPAPPPAPPEVQFASANHDKIITGLKSEVLPNGGTMHIRLDPPELGALQVKVSMQDGVMTASFETSNDDATKLLSHSLTQLKHALESQGVSVDKLHVQQSPRNESSSNQRDENGQPQGQAENQRSAQQEQQRKEMIRRMWAKLGVIQDPLDMVA